MARSAYTLEDALASGEAARQSYADTAAERNRRIQEAYDLEAQAAEQEAREQERNWGGTALQGAGLGSTFGPWGTLIGGVAGTVFGQARAVKSQLEEPGSGWNKTGRVANQIFGWGSIEPWTKAETYTGAVGLGQKAKTPMLSGEKSAGGIGGSGNYGMATGGSYGDPSVAWNPDAATAELSDPGDLGTPASGDTYGADLGGQSEGNTLRPLSVSLGWDKDKEED